VTLALEQISVRYGRHCALERVSATFSRASLIGIVGPNGAGKSTLLKAIAGLIERTGSIRLETDCLDDAPAELLARRIAYCSQSSFPAWPVSVREVVALGRLPYRNDRMSRAQDAAATARAIERMALEKLTERSIDTLSGGERARTLLARTLATRATVLLVDEPTSDLDPYHEIRTMEILREESDRGIIVIAVLHNLGLAARFCDQIVVLENGRIRASGAPAGVLNAELLADVYGIEAVIEAHEGSTLVIPWRRIE